MTSTFTKAALVTVLLAVSLAAKAQLPAPASAPEAPAAQDAVNSDSANSSAPDASDPDNGAVDYWYRDGLFHGHWRMRRSFHRRTNDLVSVGHDVNLPAGQQKDSVVAVFGSASSDGTARQDVVSVFGDTTVNGPAQGSAVAVLGNVAVNTDIGQDVVAVLGTIHLGPNAHVHGHVVSVFGTVDEDPAAVVEQGIERILPGNFASVAGLRHWVGDGLLLGRPLVFGTGLEWLWGISFAFLAIYTLLALLFRDAATHCITTLNDHPGESLITAILAVLLTPLTLVLLAITIVGILVIPIALVTLFCAAVFGKMTVLGWIGTRCFGMRPGHSAPHPALAVIVGGLIVMLLYLLPIIGFVVYVLLGLIGYGAVLYALINRIRHTTSGGAAAAAATNQGTPPSASAAPAAAAQMAAEPAAAAQAAAEPAAAASGPALSPGPAAAPLPLSTLPRATFWVRIGALLIDAVIIWVVVRLMLGWSLDGSDRIWLLALAAYGAVMWKVKGTTVGGIACDLRIVRLDSRPLDWPTAWVRALGCILSLCALGLGFLWIAIDPGRQAWHDKLAGTIVVRVPPGTPLA
jgi:uncharacterized RDD family membrane protein YckC